MRKLLDLVPAALARSRVQSSCQHELFDGRAACPDMQRHEVDHSTLKHDVFREHAARGSEFPNLGCELWVGEQHCEAHLDPGGEPDAVLGKSGEGSLDKELHGAPRQLGRALTAPALR